MSLENFLKIFYQVYSPILSCKNAIQNLLIIHVQDSSSVMHIKVHLF